MTEDMSVFEAWCMIAEWEFTILKDSAQLSKNRPLYYYFQFIYGCWNFCISILWVLHIYFWVIVKVFNKPFHPFFNNVLDYFLEKNIGFLSTMIYTYLVFYLFLSVFWGNTKFGLWFYLPTFYPVVENQTFLNSFIFVTGASCVWSMTLL